MDLESFWGIGPKTRTRLEETLGTERAVSAIEAVDVPTLTDAGLSRGRVTRVLRHAHGATGMDLLGTADTRSVYKSLLDRLRAYAVTDSVADRLGVLTPLATVESIETRLDNVALARDTWQDLDEPTREAILDAFSAYDEAGAARGAAVDLVLALGDIGVVEGTFEPIGEIDREALDAARDALASLDGTTVEEGADPELDDLRASLEGIERLEAGGIDVLEAVQSDDLRTAEEFREGFVEYASTEAGVSPDRVREAAPAEASDAADFVSEGLRALDSALAEAVAEREATVRAELEATISEASDAIDAAVAAVNEITLFVSLARFAEAADLTRPAFVDGECLVVVEARNLSLGSAGVQPISYGIGDHDLADDAVEGTSGRTDNPEAPSAGRSLTIPSGDRVSVLTGANSGGKTTLLETLCQVVLLAHMGLPVPAERARLGRLDTVVFHRRHASFNAGVLESTLRTVVPPLTTGDRTLMLVDEFEAITEPGSAADLLHGLVDLSVETGALGVFVTHLAGDLEPLPDRARVDGIFARGLDEDLSLDVDYQPRFDTIGRSTPEFIVSRLVANADDRRERAGFSALADAVGEQAVQRTLSDVEWSG